MTDITITDGGYQALEREMALEALVWRRERVVYQRRIVELTRENVTLRAARADAKAKGSAP